MKNLFTPVYFIILAVSVFSILGNADTARPHCNDPDEDNYDESVCPPSTSNANVEEIVVSAEGSLLSASYKGFGTLFYSHAASLKRSAKPGEKISAFLRGLRYHFTALSNVVEAFTLPQKQAVYRAFSEIMKIYEYNADLTKEYAATDTPAARRKEILVNFFLELYPNYPYPEGQFSDTRPALAAYRLIATNKENELINQLEAITSIIVQNLTYNKQQAQYNLRVVNEMFVTWAGSDFKCSEDCRAEKLDLLNGPE